MVKKTILMSFERRSATIRYNQNYDDLQPTYLFVNIARKVDEFQKANPDANLIRFGIGDVTEPLSPAVIDAFHAGVDEMAAAKTFRGYGPEQGYGFFREAIAKNDFTARGISVSADEIFVSDGAKCDSGNFQELFSDDIVLGITDPVYPVYVDTNVMAGRAGAFRDGRYENIVYLDCTKDNGYFPALPKNNVDLIYLCFPNNPTGAVATKEQLKAFVDYARENKALILFDAAYEAFVRDPQLPRSIFEIPGAREVAVEFRSFSKTAGFTGTRCGFTVIPKECKVYGANGGEKSLRDLWNRRHSTKFNGVSYPVQKAAEAVYSTAGREETRALTDYYMQNAAQILEAFTSWGFACTGGRNSPYVWIDVQEESWSFFDKLLSRAQVVCTPGSGFGRCGEGHIRISAFNSHENVEEGLRRIEKIL
jgi:LL-diaminopimelate aminotransferase